MGDHHGLDPVPTPSFASILATWVLTVVSARYSSAAISALDRPRASDRRTSRSRSVRSAESRRVAAGPAHVGVDQPRRSRSGPRVVSPAAQASTPRSILSDGVVFSTKPAAPALSASMHVLVEVEHREHQHPHLEAPARGAGTVAVIPSPAGISTSIRTTSGRAARTASRPRSGPSAASPTTSTPVVAREDRHEPGAQQVVVVDHEHPHRHDVTAATVGRHASSHPEADTVRDRARPRGCLRRSRPARPGPTSP